MAASDNTSPHQFKKINRDNYANKEDYVDALVAKAESLNPRSGQCAWGGCGAKRPCAIHS